jgi:nucleotide-binding universal stress UspA family protein
VDLLVAGVYRGMASRALLGSFAQHLAYHAPCPVLLVGPGTERTTVG